MIRNRPDLAALGFCALVVVCVTLLAYGGVSVPDFLPMIGLVVAGAGAGVALNDTTNSNRETLARTTSTARRTVPAPRPEPVSSPQYSVPQAPVSGVYDQTAP